MSSKWALPAEETEYKISEETAAKNVMEIVKHYHIDVERLPGDDQKNAIESALATLQRGFQAGLLKTEITDDGTMNVIQHLEVSKQTLTYKELTAKHKRAMDGYPDGTLFERQQALLGSLCGLGKDAIGVLRGFDLKIAEALSICFLAA
ncbi:hypothetical protein FACS1894142_5980 [Spirochaetia bacterium]|nr:hypothetical protein FACS1894142_5980 [Spirochaetia bacterium]